MHGMFEWSCGVVLSRLICGPEGEDRNVPVAATPSSSPDTGASGRDEAQLVVLRAQKKTTYDIL